MQTPTAGFLLLPAHAARAHSHTVLASLAPAATDLHRCQTCTWAGRDLAAHDAELAALLAAYRATGAVPAGAELIHAGTPCGLCGLTEDRSRVRACGGCGRLYCDGCGYAGGCVWCEERARCQAPRRR